MRWIFAVVLALHGIAHLVGFAVLWQLMVSPEVPYKTTLVGGALDVGPVGVRVIGFLWFALAVGFVVAAVAVALQWRVAFNIGLATIVLSLVLCAISLPEARIGLAINVLLVLFLAIGPRTGLDVYQGTMPIETTAEIGR